MPPSPPANSRITTSAELTAHFRAFLRVLNTRLWSNLGSYVSPKVDVNRRKISASAFASLMGPGAVFTAQMVVADVSKRTLAVRLDIESPPDASNPQSRIVHDHVFYHFSDQWLIDEVCSVATGSEEKQAPRRSSNPPPFLRPPITLGTGSVAFGGRTELSERVAAKEAARARVQRAKQSEAQPTRELWAIV